VASNINTKNISDTKLTVKEYKTDAHNDWCPGCGDFGILNAIHQAMAELQLAPWRVVTCSGVGCSSKTPHFVNTYGIHTLHGRVLPFALGAKMANPELQVLAVGGDGDGYGIGAGHFVHAGRRNVDIAYLVFNNEVYGLTKGQASPTLKRGEQPKSLPSPNTSDGVNPLAMALSSGFTFIARTYAFAGAHLKNMIIQAMEHKGMALVDILQPCPTYNNLHDKQYFSTPIEIDGQKQQRWFDIAEQGYDGVVKDPNNAEEVNQKRSQAFEMAYHPGPRIPVGVLYKIDVPVYYDRFSENAPILKEHTPASLPVADAKGLATTDLSEAYSHLAV